MRSARLRRIAPLTAMCAIFSALVGCGARSQLDLPATGGSTSQSATSVVGASVAGGTTVAATSSVVATSATTTATDAVTVGTTTGTGTMTLCGVEPMDTIDAEIARFDGKLGGCANASMLGNGVFTMTFDASVVSSDSMGHIGLDECPPNADCVGELTKLVIKANGISGAVIPKEAFVEVQLAVLQRHPARMSLDDTAQESPDLGWRTESMVDRERRGARRLERRRGVSGRGIQRPAHPPRLLSRHPDALRSQGRRCLSRHRRVRVDGRSHGQDGARLGRPSVVGIQEPTIVHDRAVRRPSPRGVPSLPRRLRVPDRLVRSSTLRRFPSTITSR